MDRNMVVRAAIERGMSRRQFFAMLAGAAGLAATASIGLTGCSEGGEPVEEVDYNSMSLDEIIAQGYQGSCSFEICDRRYYCDPDKAIDDIVRWLRENTRELD